MSNISFNVNNHCTYNFTKVVHERDIINRQVNTEVNIEKNVYETNRINQEESNKTHQRIDVYV
jgi:hypothetical protein